MKYRPEIDGLRAIAASFVVLFHFFPQAFSNGYLGVDLFFVISGYVITAQLQVQMHSGTFRFARFYARRVRRILPLTMVVTAGTMLAGYFLLLKPDFEKLAESAFATSTFWANIYFWRDGGYFGGADKLKPLLHMWSLAVEEQFYIIFPAIVWLFVMRFGMSSRTLIFVIATLVMGSLLTYVVLNAVGGTSPAFFLMPTRAWQFGLGALAAILVAKDLPRTSQTGSLVALLLVLSV